jgi:basic amino acid/polyamine antiporter, APA family
MSESAITEKQPELKRVMGPGLLLLFVVGDILGTGVYALTGDVAAEVGGAAWLPFLVAFLIATVTAFSYLELVTKYPQAAGAALYAHKAFGVQFVTFLVAFVVMCSGITSASTAARTFSSNFFKGFDFSWGTTGVVVLALFFMTALALINLRGVGESVKLNVFLTIIEITGLLVVIMVGMWAFTGGADVDFSRVVAFDTAEDKNAFMAVTAATSLAFFAMVGFEDSVNMAEECQDPPRIFPRAMLLGMGVAAAIYVIVAVLSSMLVPADVLAAAKSDALFKVLDAGAPGFPLAVFAAIGLFAVVNSALINMLMASRLLYGMANERIIPRPFGRVHQNRRTPWVSIVFTSAVAIVLVISADITLLGGTTALLLLAVFTIVNVAVLVLRRRDPVDRPHFRAPGWAPYVGIVLCGFLATPLSGRPLQQFVVAGILLAVGVVLWGINRLVVGRVDVDPTHLTKG